MNGEPKIIGGLYRNTATEPQRTKKQHQQNMMEENLDDSMPGIIPTISNQVSNHVGLTNGYMSGNKATEPRTTNGYIPNGRPNLRSMLQDAEMDSHM